MIRSLRAIVSFAGKPPVVGGLPAPERVRRALERSGGVAEVAVVDLASAGTEAAIPSGPALLVAPNGLPDVAALLRFCEEAEARGTRSAWVWKGTSIALYAPDGTGLGSAAGLLGGPVPAGDFAVLPAPDTAWTPLTSENEIRLAEARLFASLPQPTDGYLSRLDRRVSIALTRLLVQTPLTPNAITGLSLLAGLAGVALVASPAYVACLAGTLLVWLSAILDGCDGEVARLKLASSESGRRFDLFVDHVVNFAVLLAVPVHVHRARPDLPIGWATAALAFGVLMSMATVGLLLGKSSPAGRQSVDRFLERIASRDFVYLLIPLAAIARLEWFLYAAAIGANVFWAAAGFRLVRRPAGTRA